MRSRRTARMALWVALQSACLAALLLLGSASGQIRSGPPPGPPGPSTTLAGAADDSNGAPKMLAQASGRSSPSGASSTPTGPQARRKVRVTDPEVGRFLTGAGARLIADYGSFQVFDVDEATARRVGGREGAEVHDDYDLLMLNTGPINTTSPEAAALRARRGAFPGKRLHLVQFAAPVQEAWLDSVQKTGVHVVTYVPNNAYLVYGEVSSIAQLQAVAQTSPSSSGTAPSWRTTRSTREPGSRGTRRARSRASGRTTSPSRWWTTPARTRPPSP